MAHSHYVLDLYYAADGGSHTLRREVLRITAANDAEAIDEASRVNGWRRAVRYDVRAITKSTRAGHRLVHSFAADPIAGSEEQQLADNPAAGSVEASDTNSSPPQDGDPA